MLYKQFNLKTPIDFSMRNFIAPPVITKGPGFKRSKPGETVTFDCSFAGDPEPAVTWSKDGVTIKNGGRFTITIKEGFTELSIEKLQYSDAGNYQIALANPNGNAWAEAILDMNGKSFGSFGLQRLYLLLFSRLYLLLYRDCICC